MYLFCSVHCTGHRFAQAMDESCSSFVDAPRPTNDEDAAAPDVRGPCWPAAITTVTEELALLFVFISLFKAVSIWIWRVGFRVRFRD